MAKRILAWSDGAGQFYREIGKRANGAPVRFYLGANETQAALLRRQQWVGGGAIICPGVTIGSKAVIGSGSVFTRCVPDGVLAAGNPCRVIREITEADVDPTTLKTSGKAEQV